MRHEVFFVLLLFAAAVAADTIYKYRQADGRIVYSNRAVPGATVLETFEHIAPPVRALEAPSAKDPFESETEASMHARLQARETAWREVQAATDALTEAQERLHAGVEPFEVDPHQLAGPTAPPGQPAKLAPPALGGPLPAAPPAAGGPQPQAPVAVGGPMGKRHGGSGRSAEYVDRQAQLEANVKAAEERLDEALRRYNSLR